MPCLLELAESSTHILDSLKNMSRFFGRVLIPGSECSCTGHDGDAELILSSAALPPEAVECRDPTTLLVRYRTVKERAGVVK